MFLFAIAHPKFDAQANYLFSEKIGIFPLITQEPAKRSSINRTACTLETKLIQSVKKEVIRTFLIEKVLPGIKENGQEKNLVLQYSFNKTMLENTLILKMKNVVEWHHKMDSIFV